MAANANDGFVEVGDPGSATTLAAPGYTIGDGTITVVSTTNWPTATGVVFAIDVIGADGLRVDGSYNAYQGTVATATSITNVSHISGTGTNRNYSAGTTTRVYITVGSEITNRASQTWSTEHNQDGTHGAVTATSVTATGTVQGATVISTGDIQHRSVSLETIRSEMEFDYVASGCVWSGDAYASTRNASMGTGGASANVVYIGGKRLVVSNVTARSFTASKDTYIDVDNTGTLVYTEVTNNAASPALAANSIRIGIIVTGASNIAAVGSVNQGQETKVLPIASSVPYAVTDSLGNLICPRDPNRRVLGYKQIIANQSGITAATDITGLATTVNVPSGRKVRISGGNVVMSNGTAGGVVVLLIMESSTELNESTAYVGNTLNGFGVYASTLVTPSAGTHTYKLQIQATSGTGTINASALRPTFILVELA